MEGLCYDCAKKKGIDATEVLARQQDVLSKDKINFADMNKQLENIFKDFAENLDLNNLENIDGAITFGNIEDDDDEDMDDEEKPKIAGAAIPLGSIFSNMFAQKNDNNNQKQDNDKKQTKNDKKKDSKTNKRKNI